MYAIRSYYGARRALLAHGWPGNVRELDHAVERGVLLARGEMVGAGDLGLEGGAAGGRPNLEESTLEEAEERRRATAEAVQALVLDSGAVITSYSIHYTKLYDVYLADKAAHTATITKRVYLRDFDTKARLTFSRITSYNVCYTKLLRATCAGIRAGTH